MARVTLFTALADECRIGIWAMPNCDYRSNLVMRCFRQSDRLFEESVSLFASTYESLARLYKLNFLLLSREDGESESVFQLGSLLAKCRLGDAQPFSGTCEVEFVRQCHSGDLQSYLWKIKMAHPYARFLGACAHALLRQDCDRSSCC
jgi:hypothetical protein